LPGAKRTQLLAWSFTGEAPIGCLAAAQVWKRVI
jgi:hypothetical protein